MQLTDFFITKYIDKSSPKLFEFLVTGAVIDTCQVVIVSISEELREIIKFEMEELIVSSYYQTGGPGYPMETVSFYWTRIRITYTEYSPQGAPQGTVSVIYDREDWTTL